MKMKKCWRLLVVWSLGVALTASVPEENGINFRFTRSSYNVTIPENSASKVFVTPQEKMGIHLTNDDLDVRFKIVSGDKEKFFKAEERLVGDFWFLLLRTRTGNIDVLNRERKDRYVLEIKAVAMKRDGKKTTFAEAETTVVVTVLDVNDLNPLFYPTEYEEIVPEDTNLHESILRVSAEDADLGRNGEIYYSFKEPTEHFALSPTTGVVTLTRLLRYSERNVHHLTVLAQDRGAAFKGGSKPSTAKLKIIVKQVNLYSPEITIQHLPDIVENSNADIYAIVKVKDKDEGIHGEIRSLEIVDGDPDGHFRIKHGVSASSKVAEYNIEVLKLLDRENKPRGYNLTLKATDRGVPPRETYKSIPISIADLNDNPPIFDREIYVVDIPESAPINSPIIRLKVTDADQGKNAQTFLEIVGGNEGDEFRINPDTGMLYTNVRMDAETKSMYTLTVTAIDQGNTGTRKQSSAKVKINVVDTNDNDPLFDKVNMEVEVPENEPIGSSVAKVIAKDKDSGENAYISYSIANLNVVPFEIDHFIGVVKTTEVLDYESMRRSYVIRIRASDWGLPYRRETETQLKITIKDVNDNRPQFEKVDCVGRVSRFTPIGSEIITLSAIDFDAGNIISYRLVGGNEDSCFSLDATSGVVTVTCDLSDIGVNERVLNVTATDGTHFADVVNVVIKLVNYKQTSTKLHQDITDDTSGFDCKDTGVTRKLAEILAASEKSNSNGYKREREEFAMMPSRYGENVHAPEFINFPINIQVNESMAIGTVLVKIKAKDRDLGYNGKLIFGISSGDHSSVFRLDPDTGELKVVGFLDRERDTEYILNITVFDQGKPQKSNSRMLPITVLDVNDNAPKFKTTLASFRITENALNGTAFYRVNATDRDEGDNANIFYTLITDTDDFRVDPEQGTLFVSAPLDRERQEVYELVIRATDCAGNPGSITALHSDALIRVMVDDVNDNPPSFSLSSYTVKAREDIPIGSVIAALSANDPDLGSGGEVRYSIIGQSYSDNSFAIDNLTGTIRLLKSLDFEDRQVHSFTVSAADKGTPSLSSEVTLIVEVVDVNENLYAPVFPDFVVTGSVFENQAPGTVVVTVKATDADPPNSDDSRIGYSIKGGDGLGYFSIDSQGNIRTATVLDTETKAHYWLTIVAFDYGVVPLHSTLEVYIEVKNVNDNVPLTTEPVYYPHIKENSLPGTPIVQLTVFDPDSITITYRITSGNPESLFSIDTHSGVISTTGRKLDREHQAEHILEVTVTDDGTPPLSSTTRVVITVDDENDNSPQFQYNFYSVHIPETRHHEAPLIQTNSGETDIGQEIQLVNGTWESFPENDAGEKLFRVIALDNDFGKNGLVFYELMSGRGKRKFKIHPTTGEIYSTSSFQHGEEYNLFVRATDYGNPNRSSNAKVTVQVLPLPEDSKHSPTCPTKDHHVSVHESDAVGFLVMLMQCEDEDKDALWYKIIDGDPRSEFTIVGEEGSILIAKPLDWELQSKYNLTISVTDGINTTLTNVFVSVVDINEHRPVFSKSLYSANISESLSPGSEVLRLAATDSDQDSKVVYSLYSAQSPSSLVLFKVDYYTGSLSVAKPLDRETISEHILTVMVKDQATPAKRNFARVLINVSDANDHAPEFSVSIMQGRVFETSPPGTTVLSLNAVDKDHGLNAKVTYSLQSGNVGNPFLLDPILGTINVARDLDINTINEYMLIVKATDAGNPPLASTIPVHIMVVMADNAPPRFTRKEVAAELYENELPGLIVKYLEARSTSSLHYELVQGNVDNAFYLNPTTGVIYTNVPLDYEKIKVYNLTVTATNMAGAKAFCHVVIHLLDRNDNPPVFHETLYEGWINEGSPIASLVFSNQSSHLILTASDKDSQLNALLQYDIIEPGPRRLFHIDSTTGAIRTTVSLDHETDPVIVFHVRVTDLGKPRLSSESLAKVIIRVIDVNDCSPQFSQRVYNTSILIPTYNDIAVLQLNASDKDSPSLTKLVYSIKSGNSDNIYSVLPDDGIIRIHDPVRGAKSAPHRLKVDVSDGKFSDEAMVYINWENSQDSGLKFQKSIYYGSVLENSTKQNTVAIVTVLGSHLNEHLMFSILNPSSLFTIGATSGAVRTTGAKFDRELQEHYQLIVQVRSQESSDDEIRVAHVPVNITVLDVNDNCPIFVNLPYYAVVSVDAQKGDVITKVHAIDLDKGENGEVRYELIRGHGELFKVCRKTGEITLKQGLEGHNREYQLIIAAYDGGSRPCSTEVYVVVKVMDKSMPIFDKQFYTVSVLENIDLHSPLSLSIQAESPLGRKLIYSIVQGNADEKFSVDFNTASDSRVNGPCGLYVVDELDHETQPEYGLTVRATDGVSGVSDDVLVNVLILDVNDSPPEFTMEVYNVSVSEAAPFGTVILKLSAMDNDTGVNAKIKYSLENNYHNATEYFHIDPDDGSIYLKRSLDHEAQAVHHIIATATDCGFPSLSTTVHVWIMVLDMNDNPPKLEKNTYTWLSEEASRGQIVTIVTAIDPDSSDHNRLLYSIVGGNQQQTFSMDSTSGIVTLTNLHKLTESRIHILNVSVSDGVYTSFTKVTIEMVSANKHSPEFEKHLYETKVAENLPAGTFVTKVFAVDKDSDQYSVLSYYINSDVILESFTINNITGEIFTKVPLDREKQKVYEIPLVAIDTGGKMGFSSVRVWISDVNDNPPVFVLPEYKACIYSNLSINSGFLKVKAVDIDEDESGQVEYSIYEKVESGVRELFHVNKNTGGLTLLRSSVPYENQVYQFFIRATDKGKPPLHSDVPIDIYVMTQKDIPPIFERKDDKFFVTENAPTGSLITVVKLLNNIPVNYKLLSGEEYFTIDPNGAISLSASLDREAIPSHVIGVLASTESSPPLTALTEISLQVLDANDNQPIFDNVEYKVKVAENIKEGSSILKVHAHDDDEGTNGEVHYSLAPGTSSFAIDSHTGWVTSLVPLDRETTPTYRFTVTATDSGTTTHVANTTVFISLIDYNDNPPKFLQDSYTASVSENAIPGTVVVQVSVTDLDSEITNVVFYIIDGDPHSQFDVKVTGEVYVARPLDRETIDEYQLTIFATDGKHIAMTTLVIEILDENDQEPYCLRYRYKESISEGVPPGYYFHTVRAMDLDLDSNLKFYLTGDNAEYFSLDKLTGELKTAKNLDRETIGEFHLTAHVQDREHSDWECMTYIDITIMDINDNAPSFSASNFTATLSEGAQVGSLVTKMHAIDADIGVNRKIRYILTDSANDYFKMASDSGIITLAKVLDRETQDSYMLTVKAVDQGLPQLWKEVLLTVHVLDVNDNPPEFQTRAHHASIPESASIDTQVTQVVATSKDTGINAKIRYSIIGGNEHGKFAIEPDKGIISIAQPLDYERATEYLLQIQAIDLGTPPLSNQATVNITVLDSNDNAPLFTEVSYSARISENASVGATVAQVTATDIDTDINGQVMYSIERGDPDQRFVINSKTGKVTVAQSLDRELVSNYKLQIRATDGGEPILSTFTILNVDVLDVNDNPPLFTQTNYTVIVQEDKRPGWVVCKLLVTDSDTSPNAGPFIFEILSDKGRSAFRIEKDGTVRTAALLSHKRESSYSLHVRVYDNGNIPLYSDTWVIVKVIEESQYPPIPTPLEIWVGSYEERWGGGEIGQIFATDQDQYDTLNFSIVPKPSENALFVIDPRQGILSTLPGLDNGLYRLNVSVSDGKFTSYTPVTVTVESIWDEMVLQSYSIRVPSISPKNFIISQRKSLLKQLRLALMRDVSLLSVQDTGNGDTQILLFIKGEMDIVKLNSVLETLHLPLLQLECNCLNEGLCRQKISLNPERILRTSNDFISFVAPAHAHEVYCACNIGFSGEQCEEKMPPAECECPAPQTCIAQPSPPGFVCAPPSPASPLCSPNHTCPPILTPSFKSALSIFTWQQLLIAGIVIILILVFCIICLICRCCCRHFSNSDLDKTAASVLNSDVKRTSKLSNLEVSQCVPRPASYTLGSNNDVYAGPLNNLDTVRSYGSAGDELENVPPDYVKNLNRNASSLGHKINNDVKRLPEAPPPRGPRRTLSCVEDDARILGGYHWDCSDWVRPNHNPLPNITEVPGSEVPDSSSFHSNDSNDSNNIPQIQHHIQSSMVDPARDLATLDEELYMTYRSEEDDVVTYGFPQRYPSQSDVSTNLCDIEDSDVPT